MEEAELALPQGVPGTVVDGGLLTFARFPVFV